MTFAKGHALSEDQRDALQEIANIGMGQAGSAIAKIWGEFVCLSVPRIAHVERQGIPQLLSDVVGDGCINAIRQAFHGQLRGEVVVVFPGKNGAQLAGLLGYDEPDLVEESELLLDIANVLVGACLGSVARTLGTDIGFSAPSVMGLDVPAGGLIPADDLGEGDALFLEVCFKLEKKSFTSHLIVLMPADEVALLALALDKFLASI